MAWWNFGFHTTRWKLQTSWANVIFTTYILLHGVGTSLKIMVCFERRSVMPILHQVQWVNVLKLRNCFVWEKPLSLNSLRQWSLRILTSERRGARQDPNTLLTSLPSWEYILHAASYNNVDCEQKTPISIQMTPWMVVSSRMRGLLHSQHTIRVQFEDYINKLFVITRLRCLPEIFRQK